MPPQSLSIFFPMFNERENIERVIASVEELIPKLALKDYEISVIDDGSCDGCTQIVQEWSTRNSHVRLVIHPQNMGYGAALRTGFTTGNCDAVFYTDCDLPHDLNELIKALPLLNSADLVVGYRHERYLTLRRAIYSRVYNMLMRLLFNIRVSDVNCSFKLVRKQVLDRINLTATTAFIDGQLLVEASRLGYSIVEIPVKYTPRHLGRSNFDSLWAAWSTLVEMTRYWFRYVFHLRLAIEKSGSSDPEPH
jgi:glycosyltransferase involved in cell wall biosynthesis